MCVLLKKNNNNNMNKTKAIDVKKPLVRNVEKPIPETVSVVPSKNTVSSKIEVESGCTSRNSAVRISQYKATQKTRFNVPEMHSTLKLSKKIDEIVCPRKTKSLSDIDKTKLAVDEKVARKVNFPYDKPVFKDLIPLADNEVKIQPFVVTRGPTYQKDKEPVLSDFLEARKAKIHYHKPKNSLSYFHDKRVNIPLNNSLRLYEVLKINEN